MKMLFVMPAMQYSGAPKMMATVANWFAESGEDVTVCTFFKSKVTQNLHSSISVECLEIERSKSRIRQLTTDYFRISGEIYNYVMNKKADVVITFGDLFSTLTLSKLKKAGQCVIVSERVDPSRKELLSAYKRQAFRNANGFVFQTEGAKRCFSDDVQKNSYVIPNPVTVSETECVPFAERNKKIVSVGRFEFKQKRQDLLIKAFSEVYKKHPDYTLYFYGDGADLSAAKTMAQQTEAKDAVVFAGAVSPIEDYIKDASLMVLSSDYEGIPNAIIESMNMKIPVVSTDCSPGGARLLLGDDEYGYIVPAGDEKALAERICYAIENMDEMFDKCEKAKESLVRFKSETIAQMWKDAVSEIKNRR